MLALVATAVALAPLLAAAPVAAQAPAEWNVAMVGGPATGSGVTVAVVDTGVDADEVFGDRLLPQIDIVGGNGGDGHGHGTHVAGIAAGGTLGCDGATSAAIGVAPGANVLPVRVLDNSGGGNFDDVEAGIRAAADADATVINLSLGDASIPLPLSSGDEQRFRDAIAYAWDQGSIPVLAAGNEGGDLLATLFRSGYGDIKAVVVTATTPQDRKADYASSTKNATWGMAAPGGDGARDSEGRLVRDTNVVSAWKDGDCAVLAGTSMATPHVSGALAILRSRGLSQTEAVDNVLDTATPAGTGTGAGRLDLAAALDGLPDPNATTTTDSTTSTAEQTPTTVTTTTAASTTTAGGSTTTSESTSTTEVGTQADAEPTTSLPDEPGDQDTAADMTLEGDGEDIPGAAAIAATAAVGLVWFGWIGAFRRRFT